MNTETNYRPKEAWEKLRTSSSTGWRLVKDGHLQAVRISKRVTLIRGVEKLIETGIEGTTK